MKKSVILQVMLILLIAMIPITGCGDGGGETKLKTGDTWEFRITSDEIEYTMNHEVAGEEIVDGIDCYIFEISVEPPYKGLIDVMTVKRDKATMEQITVQKSGEYMDTPYIILTNYSYEYTEVYPYPLKVGKEYKEIVTMTSTITAQGETRQVPEKPEVNTYIYKIEAKEEITVPAGTFECYKIVEYDETGTNVIQESWVSDEIKQYTVKKIDYVSGEISELMSSSLL